MTFLQIMYAAFWVFFSAASLSCIAFGIYTLWKFRGVPIGAGGP